MINSAACLERVLDIVALLDVVEVLGKIDAVLPDDFEELVVAPELLHVRLLKLSIQSLQRLEIREYQYKRREAYEGHAGRQAKRGPRITQSPSSKHKN